MAYLLEVDDLHTFFKTKKGIVKAVNGVSYRVEPGKTLGIVGESGSGKSVSAMSILKLLDGNGYIDSGTITFKGRNLAECTINDMYQIRGNEISVIFQEPMTSLNPVYTIGNQLVEALKAHDKNISKEDAQKRAMAMLEEVGINNVEKRMKQYPHELSGGMRQRVMIAMGLICHPKLLIADEPTTALDVTIQAQVLELIQEMSRQTGAAVIMITHDLGVVASLCDRINIMYGGRLAETGTDREIFYEPNHPYTKGLLNCINNPEDDDKELTPIPGSPPDLLKPPAGCPFVDRCSEAMKICKTKMPVETIFSDTHRSSCWLNEKKNREEAQHGNTK